MMQANELRIGNLVFWGVKISEIKGIHTQYFGLDNKCHFYINILDNKNFQSPLPNNGF